VNEDVEEFSANQILE